MFYAGKSFTAIPAKRNMKQHRKDDHRLKSLSLLRPSDGSIPHTRFGAMVLSHSQKLPTREQSDAERLLKLNKGCETSSSAQGSSTDDMKYLSGTESLPVMKTEKTEEKVKPLLSTTKQPKDL